MFNLIGIATSLALLAKTGDIVTPTQPSPIKGEGVLRQAQDERGVGGCALTPVFPAKAGIHPFLASRLPRRCRSS